MEWKPDEIKALRKKLSLKQREFAKKLGVKRQTLARWESGLRTPSKDCQVKINACLWFKPQGMQPLSPRLAGEVFDSNGGESGCTGICGGIDGKAATPCEAVNPSAFKGNASEVVEWTPDSILACRLASGLSRREFAKIIGISRVMVWYLESGKKSPGKALQEKLTVFASEVKKSVNQNVASESVNQNVASESVNQNVASESEVNQVVASEEGEQIMTSEGGGQIMTSEGG